MICEDGHEWQEKVINDICHETENAKAFILLTDSLMGKHGAAAEVSQTSPPTKDHIQQGINASGDPKHEINHYK
jgi:hypothetical protein